MEKLFQLADAQGWTESWERGFACRGEPCPG